jgi:hypothetical protein
MKEKQFDPARYNEVSPAPGLAAVNTHNHEEEEPRDLPPQQVAHEELLDEREKEEDAYNDELLRKEKEDHS